MRLTETDVVIVGGGLAGLFAAYRLDARGQHDYLLFEARERTGGRILSASVSAHADDRVDLGPTWYWPEMQAELDHWIAQLGLRRFAQYEDGDMLWERADGAPPLRVPGGPTGPTALRLVGGMQALTESLTQALLASAPAQRLRLNQAVQGLRIDGDAVVVETGAGESVRARRILLALPPRLAVSAIRFTPALPADLHAQWAATATWMAPHAKYLAVYDTPFWRDAGLSGAVRSARGPLGEMHDASMPGGSAALFGFLGVPAATRQRLPDAVLRAHCRAQLGRLFGARAAEPRVDFLQDWSGEALTAVPADLAPGPQAHGAAPPSMPSSGPWLSRLAGIASEWSPAFPGYIAGAIDATLRAIAHGFAASDDAGTATAPAASSDSAFKPAPKPTPESAP